MPELATKTDLLVTKQQLETSIEMLTLRLTLRFGIMLAIAIYFIAIILL